jgi:hypothetical protein
MIDLPESARQTTRDKIHHYASTHLTWHIAGKKYGEFYKLIMQGREREWLNRVTHINK